MAVLFYKVDVMGYNLLAPFSIYYTNNFSIFHLQFPWLHLVRPIFLILAPNFALRLSERSKSENTFQLIIQIPDFLKFKIAASFSTRALASFLVLMVPPPHWRGYKKSPACPQFHNSRLPDPAPALEIHNIWPAL